MELLEPNYTPIDKISGVCSNNPKALCMSKAETEEAPVACANHQEPVKGLKVEFGNFDLTNKPPVWQSFCELLSRINAIGYEGEQRSDPMRLRIAPDFVSWLESPNLLASFLELDGAWHKLVNDVRNAMIQHGVQYTVRLHAVDFTAKLHSDDFKTKRQPNIEVDGSLGEYRRDGTALLIAASPMLRTWVDANPRMRLYCGIGCPSVWAEASALVHMVEYVLSKQNTRRYTDIRLSPKAPLWKTKQPYSLSCQHL